MSATSATLALDRRRTLALPWGLIGAAAVIVALVAMELWATATGYPLRVTSDLPTYLALLRGLALHPFAPQSPFLATPGIASPHATPYMLALALLWRSVAPAGHLTDPAAAGRFLGLIGIPVTLLTLGMIAVFAARIAGRREGLLTIPVLLVMFGPGHVIWASDLTFNGFLYAGFYPQNVALALALGALLALRGRSWPSLLLATVLCGATMIVHPLTGTLLAGLAAADGCVVALRGGRRAHRTAFALGVGFVAGMAWPDYQLNQAMAQAGIPGAAMIALCAAAPGLTTLIAPLLPRRRLALVARRAGAVMTSRRTVGWLAIAGAVIVWDLALWEMLLIAHPPSDSLIHTNRLALYWGEDRWRWFLMFGAGAVGLSGLVRLALRRQPLPLIWFTGCFGIALLGLIGIPVPVWWRFLLLAQVPLAIGTAVVLLEARAPVTRWTLRATLVFVLVFKLATLIGVSQRVTYFGNPLQPAYSLGRFIPRDPPGLVASDPFTSYYIPAVSGRRVLTVTKAHVGSQAELDAATRGYSLLHRFYTAPDSDWWPSAQALWTAGVRFVLVEKRTSLAPPTLEQFSTGPTPLVRTGADEHLLGRMHWRLRRIGRLVHDDPEYALYELDGSTLFPTPPPRPAGDRRRS